MSVLLIVQITSKSGRGEELGQLLQPVTVDNEIDGCSGVDIFQDKSDSDKFLIVEYWDSIERHKIFLSGLQKAGDLEKMSELSENIVRTYFVETQE